MFPQRLVAAHGPDWRIEAAALERGLAALRVALARLRVQRRGKDQGDEWREAGKDIQFAETRHYVDRIEKLKDIYRRAYPEELGLR